jgi:hypothetical protein
VRRQLRQNLVLAGVVALAAVAVWLVIRREQAAIELPLTAIDTTLTRELRVRNGDKPARHFERRDGVWWMREPYELPAHADAVARLLAIARAAPRSRHARAQFDLSRIGLDPPQAVLELDDCPIAFGLTDAIRGDRYVLSRQIVALMPDRFSAWLLAPAESELDHRLAAPLDTITDVVVDGRSRPELAAAWQRVTTSQVVAAQDAPATATIRVELVAADGRRIRYTLWRRDDGRYAALRGEPALLYPLDEIQMQHLLPAANAGAATTVR